MLIKKGQLLDVQHKRKGNFQGIAEKDFDTETTEFYPIVVAEGCVGGMNKDWEKGERIPCRNTLTTISIVESAKSQS